MEHNRDFDLALSVGELKGMVQGVIERLDKQNGIVSDLAKKVARHEVMFGKIGVIMTSFVFVLTVGFEFLKEFIRSKLNF